MKWTEGIIARTVARQTLASKCVVLVDRCVWTGYECDVLAVTRELRIIDIEVKISRADLKADAKKDKWWHRRSFSNFHIGTGRAHGPEAPAIRNDWPTRVWKHYYAMPAEIWKPELLDCLPSPKSGVILMREQRGGGAIAVAEVVRRATPNKDADRITAEDVIDIARLANLRMWDAYQQRDAARGKQLEPA
jgi:hypothetical protein